MTDIIAIGIGLLIGTALAVPLYWFSKREQRQRRGMNGGSGTDGGGGDGASLFDFGGHAHGRSSDFGSGDSGGDSGGGDGGSQTTDGVTLDSISVFGSGSATTTQVARAGQGAGPKASAQSLFSAATSLARQQHVDLDEMPERRAGSAKRRRDVGDDIGELSRERVGDPAVRIEAGNSGDVDGVSRTRGE